MNYLSYFLKSLFGTSLFFVFLFGAAGTLHYKNAWIFFGISFIANALNLLTFVNHPELMNERLQAQASSQQWDKVLMSALGIVSLLAYLTAGFDFRFHPSSHWSGAYTAVGFLLVVKGQLLFLISKAQNKFFSSHARIQSERNHQTISTGLYRIIRHPGYIGMICTWMGFPLLLNSLWSILPSLIAIVLLFIRTSKEDQMLQDELNDYSDYTRRVKYKLIPFIY